MKNYGNEQVPAFLLRVIEELAIIHDICLDEIYSLANIQDDSQLTVRDIDFFIEWILIKSGKPWAALEFAKHINLQQSGKMGTLIASTGTAGSALELFHRFHQLIHPYIDIVSEKKGRRLAIKVPNFPEESVPRWYSEIVLGGIPYWVERLVDKDVILHEVWFRGAKPAYFGKYVEHFDCNVLFDQVCDCLWTDVDFLDLKIKTSSPKFHSKIVLDAEVQLQETLSFVRKVKSYIKSCLPNDCSIEEVASAFCLSTRTLQRKLAENGTSIKKIKQEVKCEEGILLLTKPALSVEQIAMMLGYEHGGSFGAAFRGWTGYTPVEWRTKGKSLKPAIERPSSILG